MAENKTKATQGSVVDYIAAITDATRRQDCETLMKVMAKATQETPVMWGDSIVGFGSYHYRYESGREGDSCLTGFSSRKGEISIYLTANFPGKDELLPKLGKYKAAKACLYVRKLSDLDLGVLEQVITRSYTERKRHYS
jgi:hypothetical protein